MGECLKYYGLKNLWEDRCEHCHITHLQEVEIPKITKIKVRIQCDECIEAERQLIKIRELITKTNLTMELLGPKQEEEMAKCVSILSRNRAKRKVVLDTAKKFFEMKSGKNKPTARQPYKED